MKRKIIQLSESTKVISLPSGWIKKNSIKKGAELEVIEKDNLLIVSRGENSSKKETSIDISGINPDIIWAILDALYVSGFDDITVKTSSQAQKDTFAKALRYFPGIIIYEEKGDVMRLKNIAVQEDLDLNQSLSRIRNLTITIMDDSIDAVSAKNWEVPANAKKRDYIINMYVSLAFRHINKYGYEPMSKQGVIAQHIKILEMFSDRLCILLKEIADKKEMTKSQKTIFLLVREIYRTEAMLAAKLNMSLLSEFDARRLKLLSLTDKEEGKTGNEFRELAQLFFDMEETIIQLNADKLSK